MGKNKQIDLEEAIQSAPPRVKAEPGKLYETVDVFTGEIFNSKTPEHYERVDPTPKAPAVDLPRPTLRQRVENLINRGGDPLARYIHDGSSDNDYDIPDDPDAPLTASEHNYLDMVAADIAENAPLPDDDLPRNESPLVKPQKPGVEGGGEEGGSQDTPPDEPGPSSPSSTKRPKSR